MLVGSSSCDGFWNAQLAIWTGLYIPLDSTRYSTQFSPAYQRKGEGHACRATERKKEKRKKERKKRHWSKDWTFLQAHVDCFKPSQLEFHNVSGQMHWSDCYIINQCINPLNHPQKKLICKWWVSSVASFESQDSSVCDIHFMLKLNLIFLESLTVTGMEMKHLLMPCYLLPISLWRRNWMLLALSASSGYCSMDKT